MVTFGRLSVRVLVVLAAVLVVAAAALWLSPSAGPQPFVVGVLQYTSNNLKTLEGFKEGMAEFGYVDGETIRYVFDGPAPSREALDAYADRLLQEDPDLIFASTTPAAKTAAAKAGAVGVPVIFAPVNDPVSAGIVENPRQPEGNVTGVRLARSEGRRLQALCELAPSIRTVFVPYNPEDASARATLDQLAEDAPKLGVKLLPKPFTPDMNPTVKGYVPDAVDAIFMPREGLVMSRHKQFCRVSLARTIPLSTPRLAQVEEGVLTGYGFVGEEIGKQAARLAHRILTGTPVADLPVETAQDYLFINMATAGKMGLEIPDGFLRRVNYIIRETG